MASKKQRNLVTGVTCSGDQNHGVPFSFGAD